MAENRGLPSSSAVLVFRRRWGQKVEKATQDGAEVADSPKQSSRLVLLRGIGAVVSEITQSCEFCREAGKCPQKIANSDAIRIRNRPALCRRAAKIAAEL